jgi:hypothetical protein
MLTPDAQAAADAALVSTMFSGGTPQTVQPSIGQPQVPQQTVQPAVSTGEGDAPLPGHSDFRPSNRSHVAEPIVIQMPTARLPAGQQPQQPQQQQPNPQLTFADFFPQQGQPAQPAVTTGTPGAAPGQPQFIPPAQQTDPVTGQPVQHQVPVGVMIEERRKAQEAAAQAQALQNQLRETAELNRQMMATLQAIATGQQRQAQQPQQQAEEWIDPEVDLRGSMAQQMRHVQRLVQEGVNSLRQERQQESQARLNDALNKSQARAEAKHTPQAVAAAYAAVKAAGLGGHFINRDDPYEDMVGWHRQQQTLQTMGPDPNAWMANLVGQIRAQVMAELRGNAAAPVNTPPSLAGATSAMTGQTVVPATNDFFQHMFTPRQTQQPPWQQQPQRAA